MSSPNLRALAILALALAVASGASGGTCPAGFTLHTIDFETDDQLQALVAGDIFDVGTQHYTAYGVTITFDDSSTTCPGPLMIFDSANVTGGDDDLGSPNEDCAPPGPGIGAEGAPGTTWENCAGEGNILIFSEDGITANPDDCGDGTTFIDIDFDYDTTICEASSLDVDAVADRPTVELFDSTDTSLGSTLIGSTSANPADYGNNSLVVETGIESIGPQQVRRMRVTLPGSGSIPEFTFCRDDNFTPVTVSRFSARREGTGTHFTWSTATEIGNAGFHLYARKNKRWKRVNRRLMPSRSMNSTEPQEYTFSAPRLRARRFLLVDVDVRGQEKVHGPFRVGRTAGRRTVARRTDWASIRGDRAGSAPLRVGRPKKPGFHPPIGPAPGPVGSALAADLRVEEDGVYRVTYDQLKSAGVELGGARASALALTSAGVPVPISVEGPDPFGPGSAIEFYGRALDTLYTATNVYRLELDPGRARRIGTDPRWPDPTAAQPSHYVETVAVERNLEYSFAAPNGDPWYDTAILAYKSPVSETFDVEIDALAGGGDDPELTVDMWGTTAWPEPLDHHVQLRFNGQLLADERFDGQASHPMHAALAGGLVEGLNQLELTVVGDTGPPWDIVTLEGFELTYPRRFVARPDGLRFTAAGELFGVDGLTSGAVRVYRMDQDGVTRLAGVQTSPVAGGFQALFPGTPVAAEYVVVPVDAVRVPSVAARGDSSAILAGSADELFIVHPRFLDEIERLADAHRAAGSTVLVASLDDIYASFSHGVVDPEAIRAYIRHAASQMGATSVTLVGGDTYDYRDYLGQGAVSFLPSLYARTGPIVYWAPADPLFADLDDDGVQDLELGRLPVRTLGELRVLIDKTLQYPGGASASAVLAADGGDGATSFSSLSDGIAARLPAGWGVERAYIDELGVTEARSRLLAAVNGGAAVTGFFGHSAPGQWTFQGLLDGADAAALTNHGSPTLVTQWGCWNTYYVSPTYDSMAHRFLLSGGQGAAAVVGAATLTRVASDQALADLFMPRLFEPGKSVGQALLEAKQELAARHPGMKDVLLGFTLLGDPKLTVSP